MPSEANLKLYTNHGCPYAHRVHIVLAELGLPFEEEIIDLAKPRTPEYLEINPRGLVPSLRFNDHIVTESAIVAQFLADAYPRINGNNLLSPLGPDPADGALGRARIAFFTDTWATKVGGSFGKALYGAKSLKEAEAAAAELNQAIVKEIEPLFAGAGPFFGGSQKLTLAEAIVAPFIIRIFAFVKHGVLPAAAVDRLSEKAPNFHKWAQAVIQHPSVNSIFKEDEIVANTKQRLARIRGW